MLRYASANNIEEPLSGILRTLALHLQRRGYSVPSDVDLINCVEKRVNEMLNTSGMSMHISFILFFCIYQTIHSISKLHFIFIQNITGGTGTDFRTPHAEPLHTLPQPSHRAGDMSNKAETPRTGKCLFLYLYFSFIHVTHPTQCFVNTFVSSYQRSQQEDITQKSPFIPEGDFHSRQGAGKCPTRYHIRNNVGECRDRPESRCRTIGKAQTSDTTIFQLQSHHDQFH